MAAPPNFALTECYTHARTRTQTQVPPSSLWLLPLGSASASLLAWHNLMLPGPGVLGWCAACMLLAAACSVLVSAVHRANFLQAREGRV